MSQAEKDYLFYKKWFASPESRRERIFCATATPPLTQAQERELAEALMPTLEQRPSAGICRSIGHQNLIDKCVDTEKKTIIMEYKGPIANGIPFSVHNGALPSSLQKINDELIKNKTSSDSQ